jgi:outer membrane murein-binding lipoprotein Lpp
MFETEKVELLAEIEQLKQERDDMRMALEAATTSLSIATANPEATPCTTKITITAPPKDRYTQV